MDTTPAAPLARFRAELYQSVRGLRRDALCEVLDAVLTGDGAPSLADALRSAAVDLHQLADPYWGEVNIVAVDRGGRHAAVSTAPGRTYIVMTDEMTEFLELEREYVPAPIEESP